MLTVHLTGARATLLATLYGRALDAEAADSILRDTMSARAARQLDVDVAKTGLRRGDPPAVALRARHLDGWAREFLAAHLRATALHLGCGLDTRVYRLDPHPGVRWYDVDFPDVIDLRRQLYPPRGGYEMVGSSVIDPSWLERVPADLPVLVVAEGLVIYLTEDEGTALFRRIVDRFPGGQFVFDALSRRGIRLQRFNRGIQAAGATVS
ncbi:MAG TPA: class I SAM-dependent methyltransferase [Mycobacteriales bacterium]|nr:class I SAM-dependent methyltransferase [Mycobacteriales bacterium]